MAGRRIRAAAALDIEVAGEGEKKRKLEEPKSDQLLFLEEPCAGLDQRVKALRQRWELASVLDFLCVFEPIIGKDPKMSAEEIEAGLIMPDSSLAQLHIKLLKGIPPVSKILESPDEWMTVLLKKLNPWWPWVAEGQIPLKAANGEEKSRYKELEPIQRLLILKALCEVRLEQDDAVSYVNDSLKSGSSESCFCKKQVGGDGKETSYWYEGNAGIGHRLYRAVMKSDWKKKDQGMAMTFQWETIATNLEEFCLVADELASSKEDTEVSMSKIIKSDMIPVLQKLKKNKERALKKKERMSMLLTRYSTYTSVSLRSCRRRGPTDYTFDEYDRSIAEAIQVTESKKIKGETNQENEPGELQMDGSISSGNAGADMDSNIEVDDSENSSNQVQPVEDDSIDDAARKPRGVRWSKRLAAATGHEDGEMRQPNTKNLLRQRPIQNSAIDLLIVPDSEEEDDYQYEKDSASKGIH